jgi:glyoxylase-like metal-dependent hydrolase (beta-lactamase superfamily II)
LFVDTNVGVVAAGGYAALTQRFKEFQAESGVYKPLAYQVITHHHADHVGGVSEAVALGAKLVTVEENIEAIQGSSKPAPTASDFYSMDSRVSFGEGKNRVEVYEVSTIHAASFLVLYVPSTKTVFIADHFGSAFAKTIPDADQDSVDMLNALEALDIDIQKIATAHNPRIFTMAEMRKSVANFTPSICAGKRPVCS